MIQSPPAEIGMPLDAVDTPALLIDLDAFDRNVARLARALEGTAVRPRPHAKSHKCPVIASTGSTWTISGCGWPKTGVCGSGSGRTRTMPPARP